MRTPAKRIARSNCWPNSSPSRTAPSREPCASSANGIRSAAIRDFRSSPRVRSRSLHCFGCRGRLLEEREEIQEPFLFQLFRGNEMKGGGIDAVAKLGRRRAVIENMAEVGIAFPRANFPSHHVVTVVDFLDDVLWRDRFRETRPPRAGVILVEGRKERLVGNDVGVDARLGIVPISVMKRGLSAIVARDLVLLGI